MKRWRWLLPGVILMICFFGECGKTEEMDVKYENRGTINSDGKKLFDG